MGVGHGAGGGGLQGGDDGIGMLGVSGGMGESEWVVGWEGVITPTPHYRRRSTKHPLQTP